MGCIFSSFFRKRQQPKEYQPLQNEEENQNGNDDKPIQNEDQQQDNNQVQIDIVQNDQQLIQYQQKQSLLTLQRLISMSIQCEKQKIRVISQQNQNLQDYTQHHIPQNFILETPSAYYEPSFLDQQYNQMNYSQNQGNQISKNPFPNESTNIEFNNFQHQQENQSLEIESMPTSMMNYQCLLCNILISDSVYQTECQHSFHVKCFDEMIENQIMIQKLNAIACHCGRKLSSKILLQSSKQNQNFNITKFYEIQLNCLKQKLESENKIWKCQNQNCSFFCMKNGLENSICQSCLEEKIEPPTNKKIKIISKQSDNFIPLQQDFQQQQINNNPQVRDQEQVNSNLGQEQQQIYYNPQQNLINQIPFETNHISLNIQNDFQNQEDEYDVLQTQIYETPCLRCQSKINDIKIQTICQHNYHQQCIEEMFVMQVNNYKVYQLQCLCNVKLNIKLLFQFDQELQKQIKEQLYQNQLGLLATNLQQVIKRCPNNCGFFYINKTNEKSICQNCDQ